MTKIIVFAVLSASILLNFYLSHKNELHATQIEEQRKRVQLVIDDRGNYSLDIVEDYFKTTKKVDRRSLDCMAVNIYREAATESMAGKIAVGQVVLNRVKHKNYPGDVCAVIYQKTITSDRKVCQFSWVCTKKLPAIEKTSEAWKKSLQAAHAVLSHGADIVPDITNGATHYHTHAVSPQWKDSLKLAAVIDQHRFYRIQY